LLTSKQAINAIDRGALNSRLLDILEAMPNVKLFFNHKLTGADFKKNKAWFEARDRDYVPNGRPREIEITFDLMIGADGAHSAVRYHLMKFTRMDYQQEYIDTLWCEFHLPPRPVDENEKDPNAKFRISPNHLHIWPGKDFMFIAIPSEVGLEPLTNSTFEIMTITNTLAGRIIHLHPLHSQR
jgi:kynurenine 3-monooxygenase